MLGRIASALGHGLWLLDYHASNTRRNGKTRQRPAR